MTDTPPKWHICFGCKGPTSTDPSHKVCSACQEWLIEWMCWVLTGGKWDASVMHTWEEACEVLKRLYCYTVDSIGFDLEKP